MHDMKQRVAARFYRKCANRAQLEDMIDVLFEHLDNRLRREGYDSGEMIGQERFSNLLEITVKQHNVPINIKFDHITSYQGENHRTERGGEAIYRIDLVLSSALTRHEMFNSDQSDDIKKRLIPVLSHEIQHVEQDLEGFNAQDRTPRTRQEKVEYVNSPAEVESHAVELAEKLWTKFQKRDMTDRAPLSIRELDRMLEQIGSDWSTLQDMLTNDNRQTMLEKVRDIVNSRLRGKEKSEVDFNTPDGDPNQNIEDHIDTIVDQLWDQIEERRDRGMFQTDELGTFQGDDMNLEDLFILMDSKWDQIKDRLTEDNRNRLLKEVRRRINDRL